jgi:hypothetical protein
MKERKLIEATNNLKMHTHRELKGWTRVRRSNVRAGGTPRSRTWKLFQVMKEGKSIESMSTPQKPMHQTSKFDSRARMSHLEDHGNHESRLWQSSQLMLGYRSIEMDSFQKHVCQVATIENRVGM